MLLFRPEHVALILDGTKTQTRRIWAKCRVKVGAIHQCRTKLFGEPFAHVQITAVRQEKIGRITEEDARREGYPNRDEYLEAFARINRVSLGELLLLPPVFVVDFELVKP